MPPRTADDAGVPECRYQVQIMGRRNVLPTARTLSVFVRQLGTIGTWSFPPAMAMRARAKASSHAHARVNIKGRGEDIEVLRTGESEGCYEYQSDCRGRQTVPILRKIQWNEY